MTKSPIMMTGTDGTSSYIEVAEVDCLKIGIRPIISAVSGEEDENTGLVTLTLVGAIRIRAVPKGSDVIVHVGDVVESFVPIVEWGKKAPKRASGMIISEEFTTDGWDTPEDFVTGISDRDDVLPLWISTVDRIREMYLPSNRDSQIVEYFRACIMRGVTNIFHKADKFGVMLVPKKNMGNVVSFPLGQL